MISTSGMSHDRGRVGATIHLVQGEHRVSDDADTMISTLLGSCVSACMRDQRAGVGGMNHFLLPGAPEGGTSGDAERFAAHLMELLVNALLNAGAARGRLEAKLFGGASTVRGLSDVGARNAAFATNFLAKEGIALTGQCLGGSRGRRVQYWPVSGRARRSFISDRETAPIAVPAFTVPASTGSLELF